VSSEPDGDDGGLTGQPLVARELRRHRERAGLSRNQLANLVGYSRSYISTCEKPGAALVSEAVVTRIDHELGAAGLLIALQARADADRTVRRAGPARGRTSVPITSGRCMSEGVPSVADLDGIRRALVGHGALTDVAHGREGELAPEALRLQAVNIHKRYQAAQYTSVIRDLPDLLAAADGLQMEAEGRREHLLGYVSVYVGAAKLLTKLGAAELATIAADRAAVAARTADSLAAQGMAAYQVVCALLRSGHTDNADSLAIAMLERMTAQVRSDEPVLLSITGALWLISAVVAGRRSDRAEAGDRLDRAGALARALGTDANHGWTAFGPTNVAIHRVSVAAELGEPADALAAAATVDVNRLPSGLESRRAQVHLDLAWAQSQRRRDAEATLHLLEAERAAPESIRYNAMARETVREVLERGQGSLTPTLTGLGARADVSV
jgi:Helix-turn-helix domain